MVAINNGTRDTYTQTDIEIIGRLLRTHTRIRARSRASRAANSAVGSFRGVTGVQVLISYLSPHLIAIIGRIVTCELAARIDHRPLRSRCLSRVVKQPSRRHGLSCIAAIAVIETSALALLRSRVLLNFAFVSRINLEANERKTNV